MIGKVMEEYEQRLTTQNNMVYFPFPTMFFVSNLYLVVAEIHDFSLHLKIDY